MHEEDRTKIKISQNGVTMKAELGWDAGIDEIMTAFVGCLRGISFGEWVVKSIRDWCDDQLPEEGGDE